MVLCRRCLCGPVAAVALGVLSAGAAQAETVAGEPVGRVLSSVPLVQEVAVPSRVCTPESYVTRQPSSGAGAVVGAIAGGLLGSAVGRGPGRGMATVVGAVGGAVLGNQVEGNGSTRVEQGQRCYDETRYEQRTTGYKVVYEYAGRQYQTQLDRDPGATIALQVSPAGGVALSQGAYADGTTTVTTTTRPETVYVETAPATVYVAPVYESGPMPPPIPRWGPPGPRFHDRWGW